MRPRAGWPIRRCGHDVAEHRRLFDVLADVPGPLLLLRGRLEIATRHVQSAGIAEHVVERLRFGDTKSRRANGDDELHLVVIVGRPRRIGDRGPGRSVVLRGFRKIERRLAIDGDSHLLRVRLVVAADTEDATDGKALRSTADRRGRRRRRRKDEFAHGLTLLLKLRHVAPYLADVLLDVPDDQVIDDEAGRQHSQYTFRYHVAQLAPSKIIDVQASIRMVKPQNITVTSDARLDAGQYLGGQSDGGGHRAAEPEARRLLLMCFLVVAVDGFDTPAVCRTAGLRSGVLRLWRAGRGECTLRRVLSDVLSRHGCELGQFVARSVRL